jgi:hypothetical protein
MPSMRDDAELSERSRLRASDASEVDPAVVCCNWARATLAWFIALEA